MNKIIGWYIVIFFTIIGLLIGYEIGDAIIELMKRSKATVITGTEALESRIFPMVICPFIFFAIGVIAAGNLFKKGK